MTETLDSTHNELQESITFRTFIVALALATFYIFNRSVRGVIESGKGLDRSSIKNQNNFIGLEGAMVIVAVLALKDFHLGVWFREDYIKKQKQKEKQDASGKVRLWRRRKRVAGLKDEKGTPGETR